MDSGQANRILVDPKDHDKEANSTNVKTPDKNSLIDLVAAKLPLNSDKFIRIHFSNWQKKLATEVTRPQDMIHKLETDEALVAFADCAALEITTDAIISRYQVAKNKFLNAVEEFEENMHPELDWKAEPIMNPDSKQVEVLLLESEEVKKKDALKKLFTEIQNLIDVDDTILHQICDDQFPEVFDEIFDRIDSLEKFVKDFAEMILENDENSRDIARSICSHLEIAQEVAQNKDNPAPLIFLAQLAREELK